MLVQSFSCAETPPAIALLAASPIAAYRAFPRWAHRAGRCASTPATPTLERARLDLQRGDTAAAREQVAAARKIVTETGYRRREREVAWLEGLTSGTHRR